jgi:hypothetical protein
MATLAQLKKTAQTAMSAYSAAQTVAEDKQNKKLIGKCFKYHNSGGGCDERWWLYAKVERVEDGRLYVFTFETLPNGTINIERGAGRSAMSFSDRGSYTPIDRTEFLEAWRGVTEAILTVVA